MSELDFISSSLSLSWDMYLISELTCWELMCTPVVSSMWNSSENSTRAAEESLIRLNQKQNMLKSRRKQNYE